MKKSGLLVFLMCMFFWGYAQPRIQFEETSHDFGHIKEVDGKVTCRFTFTNVGDSVLTLVSVKPGCGCTAADYTKEPVAPCKTGLIDAVKERQKRQKSTTVPVAPCTKGFIDVTYDPSGHPGQFTKSVAVTTNEPINKVTVLFIKGDVEKRPPTVFEEAGYPMGEGMVRFKEMNVRKNMLNTESQRDTFLIRNFGQTDAEVILQNVNEKPYLKEVYRSFNVLRPNEEGKIVLEYDAAKRNAFGLLRDDARFSVSDEKESDKIIFYSVNIKEDFSKMTKEAREQAPVIVVDCPDLNFGQVKRSEIVKLSCTITNKGKSPLMIRDMQPSSYFVSCSVKTTTIEPGKSLQVEFTYKGTGREQQCTVDVICNDPENSVLPLQFKAGVLN